MLWDGSGLSGAERGRFGSSFFELRIDGKETVNDRSVAQRRSRPGPRAAERSASGGT